jgi:hypothetical protein
LSLQTRNTPQVYDRIGSQLDIRIRPSEHERLPSPAGLHDLQDTIVLIPDAITRSGAQRHCQLEQSEGDFRRFASAIHQVACDV